MRVERHEQLPLRSQEDLVAARQAVRALARDLGLSLVDQTKVITAASELGRNAVVHGGGGELRLEHVVIEHRPALRATFCDTGPGIADVEQALRDGYTSGSGLGLGLGGSRRLVDQFEISSEVGRGTCVTIVKWA